MQKKMFRFKSGQVATEYVFTMVSFLLALALVSLGIEGNLIERISDSFSENLLIITTILRLPI